MRALGGNHHCMTATYRSRSDNASHFEANSSSIFFAVASSLAMRKLRICPALAASGLDVLPPEAMLPFQRAVSMELNDDRSALASVLVTACSACFSGAIRHVP